MAVDILAAVAEQRLVHVKRSVASSEAHAKRVQGLATRAQVMLSNGMAGVPSAQIEEYLLRDMYARVLTEYTRKPQFAYHSQEFTPRGLALWRRAVKALKASGVDRETFVRAQFTWFDKTFRTAPTPVQLTTDEAVVRAASVKPEAVRTNNVAADISVGDLFRRCEKQMSDLMRVQRMTREEVYTKLVKNGLAIFPAQYLNADPVWRALNG
jgi:hypothetical protein